MKAAAIVPQAYLPLTWDNDYHLALAHMIDAPHFEEYTFFYRRVGQRADKFLILDNGLIEGNPRPLVELLEKADRIGADELVLPDVFRDSKATYKAVYESLRTMDMLHTEVRTMAVAQGNTLEEWVENAKELLQLPINTLGVPKVLVGIAGRDGRLAALQQIQEEIQASGVQIHLLGCWESPLEIKVIENYINQGKLIRVRGVDSALPYVYAKAGMRMSDGERPQGPIDFLDKDTDKTILNYNLVMWQAECGAVPLDPKVIRFW